MSTSENLSEFDANSLDLSIEENKQLQVELDELQKKYNASPFQHELDLKDEQIKQLQAELNNLKTEIFVCGKCGYGAWSGITVCPYCEILDEPLKTELEELKAKLDLIEQCNKCKFTYPKGRATCPDDADGELPCAGFEQASERN